MRLFCILIVLFAHAAAAQRPIARAVMTDSNGVITSHSVPALLGSNGVASAASVAAVSNSLSSITSDVAAIEVDIGSLDTVLSGVTGDVAALEADVSVLDAGFAVVTGAVASVEDDVAAITGDVATVETAVAALSTQMGTKITQGGTGLVGRLTVSNALNVTEIEFNAGAGALHVFPDGLGWGHYAPNPDSATLLSLAEQAIRNTNGTLSVVFSGPSRGLYNELEEAVLRWGIEGALETVDVPSALTVGRLGGGDYITVAPAGIKYGTWAGNPDQYALMFEEQRLYDGDGIVALFWNERKLYDQNGKQTIDAHATELGYAVGGDVYAPTLDWGLNRTLIGVWNAEGLRVGTNAVNSLSITNDPEGDLRVDSNARDMYLQGENLHLAAVDHMYAYGAVAIAAGAFSAPSLVVETVDGSASAFEVDQTRTYTYGGMAVGSNLTVGANTAHTLEFRWSTVTSNLLHVIHNGSTGTLEIVWQPRL